MKMMVNIDQEIELQVHMLTDNLPISSEKRDEIKKATENDQNLQILKNLTKNGWPKSKDETPN